MAVFMAGVWRSIFVNDCLNPLPAPSQGAHVPSPVQIVWNWNPVSNATGYRWNITADFATATDMGTSTTKTETGLNCLIAYTRYVWAYNACGNSLPCSLTESSTGGPLTYPGSAHTGCQCVTDGGTVETVYEGSSSYTLCKFSGTNLSPPSGWTQAGYWQQYDANTVGDACGRFVGTLPVIWSNTFGTAYGNSDINGLEPDCSTLPIFWYVWDQGGYYWVYIVASEDNPAAFNIGSSGSVSRIKIGCK